MHPSLCFLCLPRRALCLNRLFKNAKWTPSAAAGAGDGPIVRGIDLFLSDYAGFLTALVDHGHQMRVFQCLRPVPAVEGDEVHPAGVIKDAIDMKMKGFLPHRFGRCFQVIVLRAPLDQGIQDLLLTILADQSLRRQIPDIFLNLSNVCSDTNP